MAARSSSVDISMSIPRKALKAISCNQSQDITTPLSKEQNGVAKRKEKSDSPEVGDTEREVMFDKVCRKRCARDYDGDLLDKGIREWSLDDFEFVKPLGKGGTASVFCVKEKQSRHHVALKVQKATDEGILEVDVHESLCHPSVVKMIDYFYSDETFGQQDCAEREKKGEEDDEQGIYPKKYLCMIIELCNKSLFDAIRDAKRGCFSEEQAACYFRGAVNAMQHLHDNETIHCDCKSLNFLLTKDDKIKLADFGMAVPFDDKEIVGGSPAFMAPEHLMAWRLMTNEFDYRTDIYSLGIVLFEMLAGYLPYEVVENDEDSLLAEMDALAIDEGDFSIPILDLRKLDDHTSEEPFYIPPPIFPESMSAEAQDLILRLTEPTVEDRISLREVKEHAWL